MLFYGVQSGFLAGEYWQTGLYFRSSTLDINGARNVFAATMQELFTIPLSGSSAYINLMDSGDTIGDSWVYTIDEGTDRKVDRSLTSIGSTPGTAARSVPPRRIGPIAFLYPAVRTRAIGRMYLPRVSTSFMSGGDLLLSFAAIIRDLLTQAFTYMSANSGTPVIRSRHRHLDHPVSSWVLSVRSASSKSRVGDQPPRYL